MRVKDLTVTMMLVGAIYRVLALLAKGFGLVGQIEILRCFLTIGPFAFEINNNFLCEGRNTQALFEITTQNSVGEAP